jgi:hypothetical protein
MPGSSPGERGRAATSVASLGAVDHISWLMSSELAGVLQHTEEVFIPHDAEVRPVTAVRNNVLQASLTLLHEKGLYERYEKLVEPDTLRELSTNVAPCWVPIDVVHSHYRACDAMALSSAELEHLGQEAGQHARKVSIVVPQPEQNASFDLWQNAERMHRVWKRLYQGGSVQVVRLGANEELIEFRGFSVHQHRYFRYGCVAAIRSAHEAVGLHMKVTKIARYDSSTHDLTVHLAWA